MFRSMSRRNINLHQGQHGICSIVIESSKVRMSRYLDTSTKTQMAKIMVQYGRSSRSSWAKSVQSSSGRTVTWKAIWENPIEIRLGEGFQLGMLIRIPWKGVILICICGWHQIGWKENINPMWKVLNEEVDLGEPTSFFDHVYLGCTQRRECETSKDIVDNYRSMFDSRISAAALEKYQVQGNLTRTFPHGPMTWKGMQEMRGKIFRTGKQNNSTAFQSRSTIHWRSPIQGRRIEICGRFVKSLLKNCSAMLVFGPHW